MSHPQGGFETSSPVTGLGPRWRVRPCLPPACVPCPSTEQSSQEEPRGGSDSIPTFDLLHGTEIHLSSWEQLGNFISEQ